MLEFLLVPDSVEMTVDKLVEGIFISMSWAARNSTDVVEPSAALAKSGGSKAVLLVEISVLFIMVERGRGTGSGDTLGIGSSSNRLLVGRDLGDRFQSDDSVVELIVLTLT